MSKSCDPIMVRSVTTSDAERIVNIHFRAVHETARTCYSEEIVRSWSPPPDAARVARVARGVADGQEMLVAEVEGTICGFGSIVPAKQELRAVYVDPNFGRRGVGSAILLGLEALAAQLGIPRLSMDASINAEAFYRKHGYAVVSRRMHRLSSGVEMDCVKMTKAIAKDNG